MTHTTKEKWTKIGPNVSMRISTNDKSDAEKCRQRGWTVGTRLVGDEGYGPTVIEITAIGERGILAKQISHKGIPEESPREGSWGLSSRDWQKVQP